MKLNEDIVKSLSIPESGNRFHYFPNAVIQGAKAPAALASESPRPAFDPLS